MPWLSPLKSLVLRMFWPTIDVLPRLPADIPLLLISGERDALVPPPQMRALEAAARMRQPSNAGVPVGGDVRLHIVAGGTHDDCAVSGGLLYVETIRRFIDDALTARCGEGNGLGVAGPPRPVFVPPGVPAKIVPGAQAQAAAEMQYMAGGETAEAAGFAPSLAGVGVPLDLEPTVASADLASDWEVVSQADERAHAHPLRDDAAGHAVPLVSSAPPLAKGTGSDEL